MKKDQKMEKPYYLGGEYVNASKYCKALGIDYNRVRQYKFRHKCSMQKAIDTIKNKPKKLKVYTCISIIVNNRLLSVIPFEQGALDTEIRYELSKEFADFEIPAELIDTCMLSGYIDYNDFHVHITDFN